MAMFLVSACGSDDDKPPQTITATFIDSAVTGLNYKCGDDSGITNAKGEFTSQVGQTCSFDLGGFSIGQSLPMTSQTQIMTPYEVAKDANEAIRVASLLQTLDTDGNPENGIEISDDFDGNILDANLLKMNEVEFVNSLTEATNLPVVSFVDAKKHLDTNVGTSKGYHSTAVAEIVADVSQILPEIEQHDLQAKLAEYHSILDTGDDSNNADIESLRAILAIAEVVNDPLVSERIDLIGFNPSYTEMLPKLLDAIIKNIKVNISPDVQGKSDDVAAILYSMAEKLTFASAKLATSFKDPSYTAMYSKDDSYHITHNDAKAIQASALAIANILSTMAAYQYGDDNYLLPKSDNVKVDIITYKDGIYSVEKDKEINADYIVAEVDPNTYINDVNIGLLRNDPKYLVLAQNALSNAIQISLTYDYAALELTEDELTELTSYLNKINDHLQATDGVANPLQYETATEKMTVNLHAFYNIEQGLDRSDIELETSYLGTYSDNHSKLLGQPSQATTDYLDTNGYLKWEKVTPLDTDNYWMPMKFTNAISVKHDINITPKDSIKEVIIECKQIINNQWQNCF